MVLVKGIKGRKGVGMLLGVILMVFVVAVIIYIGIQFYGALTDDADDIITIDDQDPTIWGNTQAQNRKQALKEFYTFVEELKKVAVAESVSGDSNLCFGTFSHMPTLLGSGYRIKIEKDSNGMAVSLLQWVYDPKSTGSQKSLSDWQVIVTGVPIAGYSPCIVGGKDYKSTANNFINDVIRGDEYKETTHPDITSADAFGRIVDRIDLEDKDKIVLWVDYDDKGNKITEEERSFDFYDLHSFTGSKKGRYNLVFKYNNALCFVPNFDVFTTTKIVGITFSTNSEENTKRCKDPFLSDLDGFISMSCFLYYENENIETVPGVLIDDPDKKGMICNGFQPNYISIK